MNTKHLILAVTLTAAALAPVASAQTDITETEAQRNARMAWWREARFGMFIHWGVYSVPAGFYHGNPVPGIGEWIMNRAKIPCAEYRSFAKEFNPVKFNADDWVRLAKDAGMKYIVITSKHHDGFAMFDTRASDWSIMKASPIGRDPLKELAAACHRQGVKLGFYYSQAQDWNNGGSAMGGKWDKAQERSMDEYIDKVAVPQVREILSNYGEFPAVLWWDTPEDMNRERAQKLYTLAKQLKPSLIMNNRLGGGFKGDTETPEQFIPPRGYPGRDWETCMTMNDTWGYKRDDFNWKSTTTLIRNLCDIASKGGNYLLNVGPTSEGLIPQPSVGRLAEIGKWMRANGEAIYDTAASPFRKQLPWGRCTQKSGKLFLLVFDWPANGDLELPLQNPVESCRLLADPRRELKVTRRGEQGWIVHLGGSAPDTNCSVIEARITGEPRPIEIAIAQAQNGSIVLHPSDADILARTGTGPQVESKDGQDNLGYWTNPSASVSWTFPVTQPGQFAVSAAVATPGESSRLSLEVAGQTLHVAVPKTGDYGRFQTIEFGTVILDQAQSFQLTIRPVKDGWSPVNVRALTLRKVQ